MDSKTYLALIEDRFGKAGYKVNENEDLGSWSHSLVARRSRFEITKFGIVQRVFVVAEFEKLDTAQLMKFSTTAFDFGMKTSPAFPPRGFGRALAVFPVAVVPTADPATVEAVTRQAPPKHFSAFEFPVVVDLAAGQASFYTKTQAWGAAYFRGFRKDAAILQP